MPETTRSNLQPHELSKMIIGDDDVDVSRWKQLCSGDYAGDEVVAWFWEHMESCSAAERLCVLQWTTGYSRLPSESRAKYRNRLVFPLLTRVTFSACSTSGETATLHTRILICRQPQRVTVWDSWFCQSEWCMIGIV